MSKETQKWIDAGKLLAEDPHAQVLCPRFEDAFLEVQDIRNPRNPNELERILKCSKCGATNILRLRRPLV
jgi:hypothetical protein